jgi:carboxyl-terminal processing protease
VEIMCRKSIVALLLVSLFSIATLAEPQPAEERQRVDLESFDHVWTTIRDRHWDPEMGGLDWDALREELRPKVVEASDRAEARAVMDELISRLGMSHYAIIPAEAYAELDLPDGRGALDGWTGLDVRVVGDRALVTSVAEGSPAGGAGVRPGWTVSRVGDDDIAPVLETIAEEFADNRYRDLALAGAVLGRLSGPVGEEVRVTFLDGADRNAEKTLVLAEQRGEKIRMGYLPPIHVWIESRPIDETVGYIAFNMFVDPGRLMPVFNEAMASFMEKDGLVIDLRGNPGGLPAMAMGMAGWLISEKSHRLGTMITRETELKLIVFPRPQTYSGPVAVLVDGLSGSCSEILAGGLKDLDRAKIFGTRTAGAALPSMIEKLPNGDGFQYAFANYVSASGEELEAVGVIPDVEVSPSREALLAGYDPVLDAAVTWIRRQGTPRPLAVHQEENEP